MSQHRHWPEGEFEDRCVDVDPAVCLEPFTLHGDPEDAPPAGFILWHEREGEAGRCGGSLHVRRAAGEAGPMWQISGSLAGGDLTLAPSVLCHCGFHGWVRGGRWERA